MLAMAEKFIRVYQNLDVHKIKPHILIYGDLGGACGHCNAIDIKLESPRCPSCQNDFKFVTFRNIKTHIPKVVRLLEQNPQMIIVDFEDYKQSEGANKAKEFFK